MRELNGWWEKFRQMNKMLFYVSVSYSKRAALNKFRLMFAERKKSHWLESGEKKKTETAIDWVCRMHVDGVLKIAIKALSEIEMYLEKLKNSTSTFFVIVQKPM